jgi:hypothetical protein
MKPASAFIALSLLALSASAQEPAAAPASVTRKDTASCRIDFNRDGRADTATLVDIAVDEAGRVSRALMVLVARKEGGFSLLQLVDGDWLADAQLSCLAGDQLEVLNQMGDTHVHKTNGRFLRLEVPGVGGYFFYLDPATGKPRMAGAD